MLENCVQNASHTSKCRYEPSLLSDTRILVNISLTHGNKIGSTIVARIITWDLSSGTIMPTENRKKLSQNYY